MTRRLTVKLNGKVEGRPRFGLDESPYPIASRDDGPIAQLGKIPIRHREPGRYIREILQGYSPEFQDLCVSQYKPGEVVEFDVTWEE